VNILAEIHRRPGVNIQGKTIYRTAVRAVIQRGRDLLMVYSANVGDYKFPGGGVDSGELHEQALARELREECGASLLSVAEEKDFDVFKMTSHYYFCQAGDGFGAQKLNEYERNLGFKPVWVNIDEAISTNKSLLNSDKIPEWLKRKFLCLNIFGMQTSVRVDR
jgi:8-oxo-dGTP diphosphatase